MPDETPDDTRKTLELLDDLSGFKSLIVPLFFVPIGNLNGQGFFKSKKATPEQWQLLATCIKHNFKWIYSIAEENLPSIGMNIVKQRAVQGIIRYMEKRLTPYVKMMEEGQNPIIEMKSEKVNHHKINLQSYRSKITHLMDSLGKM